MIGESARSRRRVRQRPGLAESDRRTVPFDYAFRFNLNGAPGTSHQGRIEVSVESPFNAVSIGYGVVPAVAPVTFGIAPERFLKQLDDSAIADLDYDVSPLRLLIAAVAEKFGETPPANIGAIVAPPGGGRTLALALSASAKDNSLIRPPGPDTARALRNGFRFNPEFAELLLQADTRRVPVAVLSRCFQVVTPPVERVQFKYALFDDGTGREFQNEPILNLAGLGAADGGRPFRYFARPIEFGPRSVIRMQITEVGDFLGELHISLQGYKVLGGAGSPTGRARS